MSVTSLKSRVINGSIWTIGGNAFSQLLRLAGNLALTRLLFPEAFGLMALVQVFVVGISMLSDIGINASIIQNKRSDEKFLNTAWTLQIIRGLVIWLLICIIAWPAALFYEQEILFQLLIVSSLSSIILGFQSTKFVIANRNIELKKITITEVTSTSVGMVFMIIGAWLTQSVWALVIGGLIQSCVKAAMSFFYFKGKNNYLCWEKESLISIYKFGRWLMLSSLLTFLAAQVGRLVIGRIFGVGFLGIYSIATALVTAAYMLIQKLSSAIFFASYSEIFRERPEQLYGALRKSRIAQIVLLWPIAVFMVFFGEELISFLYDERYIDAGWMLEILALGMLAGVVRASYTGVLIAIGKPNLVSLLLAIQVITRVTAIIVGNIYGGQKGMVYAVSLMEIILYPVDALIYYKNSLWQPELDIPVVILSFCIVAIYFL